MQLNKDNPRGIGQGQIFLGLAGYGTVHFDLAAPHLVLL